MHPILEMPCIFSAVSRVPLDGCPRYIIPAISDVNCRNFSDLLICLYKSSRTSVPALFGKGNGKAIFKKNG